MRPPVWRPPVQPSPAEQAVMRLVRRAKLFVWLRQHRLELFDDDFQAELARAYQQSPKGQPPVPPAQLALATILQAYTGASDDEVIEALVMDRRWQLVLDCLDAERAPFAKGTLVGFRARLLAHHLDRRLVERTVALAKQQGGFGDRALRAALDASPLWGAARVEDTINLLGHALRKALGVIARQQGRGLSWNQGITAVAAEAGVGLLGGSSLKAALDRDWDDPVARDQALGVVLEALEQVEAFVADRKLAAPGSPRRSTPPGRSPARTCRWTTTGRQHSSVGSPRTGGSRSRMRRCATAAKAAATSSTATSGTCSATLTPAWSAPWG